MTQLTAQDIPSASTDLLFSKLQLTSVLVVGDVILDEYLWGKTERISPEAPVQVVALDRSDLRLGGAANVAINLAHLGCRTDLCSSAGDDVDGQTLSSLLGRHGLAADGILLQPARQTTRKTRVIASHQQMLRIDREQTTPLSADEESQLLAACRKKLEGKDLVVISDYQKGCISQGLTQALIRDAQSRSLPVFIDPKGDDYEKYRGATLLTPNRKEFEQINGRPCRDLEELSAAGTKLIRDLDLQGLLITLGKDGMLVIDRDKCHHLATEAREVFDVSGAGDTVLAALGAATATGLSLTQAAIVANIAAGIVVGKLGTATVSSSELYHALNTHPESLPGKVLGREFLAAELDRKKLSGRKIVFTNGCFDILHAGHVRYLQQARKLGDLLIVGVNTDASVQRLKGSGRPLTLQDQRAEILAALSCVDYVTLFDEDTPKELIEAISPDILVKGGDYLPEGIVGKEHVEKIGGKVLVLPLVPGVSTTALIDKCRS